MMRLPRVSVCLLTYKRAAILPRTLDSLLGQTHSDFELVINDDSSPDGTEAVCREYARRDHRVRYFRNAHNLRYAGNQNAAVLRAATDYVAIVHDGDVYRPDMLRRWTEALHAHANAALVFNAADRLDAAGRVVGIYRHDLYADVISGDSMLDEMLSTDSSPIYGIVMLRRTRVLEAGPFDPRLPVLADVDMWMRLLLRNDVAYLPEPLYAIAPREAEHHNCYENWRVAQERELIWALNFRRRSEQLGSGNRHLARLSVMRRLWQMRILQCGACGYHLKYRALREGLAFMWQRPWPLDLSGIPDSVLTWDDCEVASVDEPKNCSVHGGGGGGYC